jgi:polysaccharide export outer membrane protein
MVTVRKRQRLTVALALAVAAAVSSCSSYRPAPKAFHEATIQPYRVDSGDRLRVTVFDQKDLSNTYSVDQAGYVAFPLIGSVAARGRTLQELEGMIAAQLQKGSLRNPDVTRKINGEILTGRVLISDPVLAGDTIYVRERLF